MFLNETFWVIFNHSVNETFGSNVFISKIIFFDDLIGKDRKTVDLQITT